MIEEKVCAICGFKFSYDNSINLTTLLNLNSEGAKLYFNLWHYNIQVCPNCGYACKNITETENKNIVKNFSYNNIVNLNIVQTLTSARPNNLLKYLKASEYYKSIGDTLNESLCNLQASDEIYGEMLYWQNFVYDDEASEDDKAQNKKEYESFRNYAEMLRNKAINGLKSYVSINKTDTNNLILLAGVLIEGDANQKTQGSFFLDKLKREKNLSGAQQKIVEYLTSKIK